MLKGTKVLLVDDEDLLREVVAMMIEDNGAEVVCAGNGSEALRIFKEQHAELSCVVMDFSMPEMNGYQAFCAMQEINPNIAAILVSGLDSTPEVNKLLAQNKVSFLNKPFHENTLLAAIRKCISSIAIAK